VIVPAILNSLIHFLSILSLLYIIFSFTFTFLLFCGFYFFHNNTKAFIVLGVLLKGFVAGLLLIEWLKSVYTRRERALISFGRLHFFYKGLSIFFK
jgi:hypothetical protein